MMLNCAIIALLRAYRALSTISRKQSKVRGRGVSGLLLREDVSGPGWEITLRVQIMRTDGTDHIANIL